MFFLLKQYGWVILGLLALFGFVYLFPRFCIRSRFYFTLRNMGIKKSLFCVFVCGSSVLSLLFLLEREVGYVSLSPSSALHDPSANPPHTLSSFFNPVYPNCPRLENMEWGILLPFLAGVAGFILLSGCLITALVNGFGRHAFLVRSGETSLGKLRGHTVIIGAHPAAKYIIEACLEEEKEGHPCLFRSPFMEVLNYWLHPPYILLLTSEIPEQVRGRLAPLLEQKSESRVIIMKGNRSNRGDLKRAGIMGCSRVYVLGEASEAKRDDLNMQCVKLIDEISKEGESGKTSSRRLTCRVLFDSYTSYLYLQRGTEMPLKFVSLEPECFYKNWAERVLCVCGPEAIPSEGHSYCPLDGKGIDRYSEKHVHLVVVGLSDMGVTLALEAAHVLHFPNFNRDSGAGRSVISLVDRNIESRMQELRQHLPVFFDHVSKYGRGRKNVTDLVLDDYHGDVRSSRVRRHLIRWAKEEKALLTIAVCLDNPEEALSVALSLPAICYDSGANILVYQRNSSGMFDLIRQTEGDAGRYRRVYPFGMTEEDVGLMESKDIRAEMVQYLYDQMFLAEERKPVWCLQFLERYRSMFPACRAECLFKGADKLESDLRFYLDEGKAKERWQALQAWEKFSNRYASSSVWMKLRSLGGPRREKYDGEELEELRCQLACHVEELAAVEHHRWIVEKLLTGYRPLNGRERETYREEQRKEYKDRMIHPDLCPYRELRDESKKCNLLLSLYLYLLVKKW